MSAIEQLQTRQNVIGRALRATTDFAALGAAVATVERGGADGLFITTAGVGPMRADLPPGWLEPRPGDKVLIARFGQFSLLWADMCQRMGLEADVVEYLGAQELLHLSSGAGDLLALVDATHRTKRGDRVQLQQVAINLLMNGAEAMGDTPAGQRRQHFLRVTVRFDAVPPLGDLAVRPDQVGRPGNAHELPTVHRLLLPHAVLLADLMVRVGQQRERQLELVGELLLALLVEDAHAEDRGLALQLGDWVLREACRQQVEWAQRGLPLVGGGGVVVTTWCSARR